MALESAFPTVSRMPAKPNKSRVLLVEDHAIVRQGLTELINHEKDLTVCGHAENCGQTLDQIVKCSPEVLLMDITLNGANGIEVLKQVKSIYPKLKVVMLSMHDEKLYALRSIRAGASGYVMKHEATEQILDAIRKALAGDFHLSSAMERRALQQLTQTGKAVDSPLDVLSDRELEVFALLGDGKSTRQIAEELNLSVKTIESHRANIKVKLNLESGIQLVQHAIHFRNPELSAPAQEAP